MRYALVAFGAAMLGAVAGASAVLIYLRYVQVLPPPGSGAVQGREFVLIDGQGHPAAKLGFHDKETVLQFLNQDSSVALELGADRAWPSQHLYFFGKTPNGPPGFDTPRLALNTELSGDANLYLKDLSTGLLARLGALQDSDSPSMLEKPAEAWGLEFRDVRSVLGQPLLGVVVGTGSRDPKAAMFFNGEKKLP